MGVETIDMTTNPADHRPPTTPMARFVVRDETGAPTTIVLSGELDASNAGDIRRLADRVGEATQVVIDLREVDFIDSAALGALVAVIRASKAAERVTLRCIDGLAARTLHLSGVSRIAEVEFAPHP